MQPLKQRFESDGLPHRLVVAQTVVDPALITASTTSASVPMPSIQHDLPPIVDGRPSAASLTSPVRQRHELLSPRSRGATANQVPGVIPQEMSARPLPASPLTLERRDSSSGLARSADSPIPKRVLPPSPRPGGGSQSSGLANVLTAPPVPPPATSPSGSGFLLSPRHAAASPPTSGGFPERAQSPTPAPLRMRGAVINLGEVHVEPARKPLPIPPGRLHNFPTLPPPALPPPPAPPAPDGE
jgi:hypothetical protein